jgi:outer membrane protein assembly factor BamB
MKHFLSSLLLLGWAAALPAADWSNWRGPEQNGFSRERDLPEKFSADPSAPNNNLLWKAPYGGITTPIIQGGRVYIINKVGEGVRLQECVMCFDADTGKRLWEYPFNVFLTDIVRDRLGWTNMAGDPETGYVYAHGTQGFLFCFDKDGKVIWQHSLTEEYGRITGYGGRVTTPIVDGNLLILSLVNASWGEQTLGGTRVVAFDKRTGAVVWWGSTGHRVMDTYYSCPVVANIAGQRLFITGGGDGGVHAFKVRTGEKVWSLIFGNGAVNCSPVVNGDRVYIGHGEENDDNTQGRVICVDGSQVEKGKPKLVWSVDGIKVKYASPILHDGRLYVCNATGTIYCLDEKTGKELWSFDYGKNTKGSPVLADGKIYVGEVDSGFHILKPEAESCNELHAEYFKSKGVAPVEINGSPSIVNGRIYFLTSTDLYCIGKKDHKTPADPAPPQPPEAAKGGAAYLQIVPADVAINPGEKVDLKAYAYDHTGQLLGPVKVDWTLAGSLPPAFPIGMPAPPAPASPAAPPPPLKGELSAAAGPETKLTVANAPPGQFGRVIAKMGDLTAYTRVRVAPVLPLKTDFSKVPEGRTPGGWVNTQGKFSVGKLPDGTFVLKKRNDNPSPLVSRAHAFIGLPHLTNYTIEADVQGSKLKADMPDIGISSCRYMLQLEGNTQQLRLISWDAERRVNNTIPWTWQPDVWYRMKLTVSFKDGKGLVKGKVWPRGETEPEKWSVEVEDPVPNKEGAPTLYAYSAGIIDAAHPGTEIYFDNVRITPNK